MKQSIRIIVLVLFSTLCAPSFSQTNGEPSSTIINKLKDWISIQEPIIVYGRVVDQYNDPVDNAEVIVAWRQFTLDLDVKIRSATVTTDMNGNFTCRITSGVWPIIRSLGRDGYELIFDQNPVMNLHLEKQKDILAVTTPTNPVILKLRKKGDATLLLSRRRALVHASAQSNQYDDVDLVLKQHELLSPLQAYKDLQVSVSYNQSNQQWTVIYTATNGADGLIVSQDVLYEAPETGYQQKVTIHNPSQHSHIYLRSRSPVIYSRIDAEHLSWRLQPYPAFSITITALINPYGSRNLEYDVRLDKQWRLKDRLVAEAKSQLANKQYPPIPDLDELIANEPP